MSAHVRSAVVALYTRLYIRRLTNDAHSEAQHFASAVCRFLYLRSDKRLSAAKTLALAAVSFSLVAAVLWDARVWYGSSECEPPCDAQFNFVMLTWSGERPDIAAMDSLPPEALSINLKSASARPALPLTFLFHWCAEAVAGLLFLRFTRMSQKHFLILAPLGLFAFLVVLAVIPTLASALAISGLALSGVRGSWGLLLATQASLANGPGLAFGSWPDIPTLGRGIASSNARAFSLSILSSLTFATGLIAVLLANAAARSRVVISALELLVRSGLAGSTTLIVLSVSLFGFLADGSASARAISNLLVKLFAGA